MAIHKVKSENGRLLAHIRTHANQYVSLSPARRWSPDEARLVAGALAAATTMWAAPAVEPPAEDPKEPPLHGRGSSRVAWVDYARSQGVEVTGTMTREDIRAAVHAARAQLVGV